MKFIDTHAHLYHEDYPNHVEDLIQRALDQGIEKIISVGVDLTTSEECIKLSEKFPSVYATCGYHPHEAIKAPPNYLYELEEFLMHPKVVAIGEIGLDYHYNFSKPIDQKRIFHEQLEMANSLDTPAIVHCRKADNDVLTGILETNITCGVIHCFASDLDFANSILKTGFYLSFTGMITFVKELKNLIKNIPLNKIMLETDSPYLSPTPYRGKKNEPAHVTLIAEEIASIKKISLNEVAESTTKTAKNLFTKLAN